MAEPKTRTMLWCVPRSGSTALLKCLSSIDNIEAWFEPYCHTYLAEVEWLMHSNVKLPMDYTGNEDTFGQVAQIFNKEYAGTFLPENLSYTSIKNKLESSSGQHIFVKDMAHGMSSGHFRFIPKGYKHAFLIRHPLRVLQSSHDAWFEKLSARGLINMAYDDFDLKKDNPFMENGLYFKKAYDLWKFIRANIDPNPIIIDGDDLMSRPAEVLPKFCNALGLPYNESLLQWNSSLNATKAWKTPIVDQDYLKATFTPFYDKALHSDRFHSPSNMPSHQQVTRDVQVYSDEIMTYYLKMYEQRISVESQIKISS